MAVNNHNETAHSPSKLLFRNNATTSNLDQLFPIGIVTTSGSLEQYTTTNMIPNQEPSIPHVSEQENISIKQLHTRRRRQRQRQRRQQKCEEQRRQQEAQWQRQEKAQQRSRQKQKQRVQRPGELQIQKRQEPEPRRIRLPSKTWSELDHDQEYWYSHGFEDYMEDYNTPLLEAYDWEKMDPKQRWEQEQLNDFEGFLALEQLALINDELGEIPQIETIQTNESQVTPQQQN